MAKRPRANPYDPVLDALTRWPGWMFALVELNEGTEYISEARRLVLLDLKTWASDVEGGIAHGIAHLDLDHHKGERPLDSQDERDAAGMVKLRFDETEGPALFSTVNSI